GPIFTIADVHASDAGAYDILVTNSFGSTTSSVARWTVYDFSDALNTSNIVWAPGSDTPWFVQSAVTRNGLAAAQSGAIGTNQTSTFQAILNGPGVLNFWWKVS